ncbi:putative metalloprotease family M14A [Phytophthora cinnamomi]|uniref:putative metalloprotease family M14A n=1 Tax=Phytophthora cinnamomi TaxID=4785 RepID=UPI00355A24DA|nr:putative metalloprotease family M14A [Phytophthora cinnamomi]
MSTVHALLTMLQDRGKRSPASVRHLLLELASCCRCEDAKAAILADGLEPLLALAADDQELPRGETLEVLLELLVLLILDNSKAKTKAACGGALELAVRCLHELSAGAAGGRRRAKILKRALELVDLLSNTTESQQQERQTTVIKQVVELLKSPGEDTSVLVRATDTLGRFIDGSLERIQVAATEQAIAVLIELLKLNSDNADLKRTACEVLMLMGEAPGLLQMMAAQNIVGALCICLRVETPARDVEFAVFTIQEEDITLPALFLCLRNYHEDVRFTSQVFAIMARHWKTQCQEKSVHSITGYVGIAVEILCRAVPASKSLGDETAEIINFIREMMLAKDGAEVVLSCGGKDLLEVLHTYLPTGGDNSSSEVVRDSSVLLPSPVGEVMTRSPKAPANRIRFRGAGRQFAAVNTIPRASIHDILRSDSVTAFQSYEADLINASSMIIRQRGSIPASNNAPAATDEKNISPPSSSYLSFPSVM